MFSVFLKHAEMIFVLFFLLFAENPKAQECNSVMSFKDSMFQFQSPNYPESLENGTYVCTLKIEHTPNSQNEINDLVCDNSQNGTNSDGGSDDNSDGSSGQNGMEAICQVSKNTFLEFAISP